MYFLRYGTRTLQSKCIPQTNKSRGLRVNDTSSMQKPVLREIHFTEFVTYKISHQKKENIVSGCKISQRAKQNRSSTSSTYRNRWENVLDKKRSLPCYTPLGPLLTEKVK